MGVEKYIRYIKIFLSRFSREEKNGFNYIISLGYNCEVAYRFLKYFRYEESSLFNWSYSKTITDLIYTLNNLDKLGSEGFIEPNPLWECKVTHIQFHGRQDMLTYLTKQQTEVILKRDLADLESRLAHLRDKFISIAKSRESKLYIYKMKKEDITQDAENIIESLYNALESIGAQNFRLLIVQEKAGRELQQSSKYLVRTVSYFAPDEDVTNSKFFNNGWDNIYAEFYQNQKHSKYKKKKYKFDKSDK